MPCNYFRQSILIVILITSAIQVSAQEHFFTLLPGWRNTKILENDSGYTSIGINSTGYAQNHYQFTSLSFSGEVLNSWEFDIDSVYNLISLYTNDYSASNENHYISGFIQENESYLSHGTLMKFNSDFSDTLSSFVYNLFPFNGTQFRSHINTEEDKTIISGHFSNSSSIKYASLIEIDTLGSIGWRRNFFCWDDCGLYPFHVLEAYDGGYFFTCMELHNLYYSDYYEKTVIIKTDSLGVEQYRFHPEIPNYHAVAGWVLPTDDGNFITAFSETDTITGYLSQNNPNSSIWLKKFSIDGVSIFDINLIDFLPVSEYGYRYDYRITQMINSPNGEIIIIGNIYDKGFILSVSQNGVGNWIRFISAPIEDARFGASFTFIYGITATSDGGYILGGYFLASTHPLYPQGIQSGFALKIDGFGCLEPGCHLADNISEYERPDLSFKLFPNPASDNLNISINEHTPQNHQIVIYNLMGKKLMNHSINSKTHEIDVSHLTPGMYLLEVRSQFGIRSAQRFVVD